MRYYSAFQVMMFGLVLWITAALLPQAFRPPLQEELERALVIVMISGMMFMELSSEVYRIRMVRKNNIKLRRPYYLLPIVRVLLAPLRLINVLHLMMAWLLCYVLIFGSADEIVHGRYALGIAILLADAALAIFLIKHTRNAFRKKGVSLDAAVEWKLMVGLNE